MTDGTLEQRADREFKHALALARIRIEVEPISNPQGPERRDPPHLDAGRFSEIEAQAFPFAEPFAVVKEDHAVEFGFLGDRKNEIVVDDDLAVRAQERVI